MDSIIHSEIVSLGGNMGYVLRDSAGRQTPVGAVLRMGSDPTNQIIIQGPRVSPLHATLREIPGGLLLQDENSISGTFVNQIRIPGSAILKPGDQIAIEGVSFIVDFVPVNIPAPPYTPPPPVPPSPPAKKSGCCGKWLLVIVLVSIVACLVLGGAGYYFFTQGIFTQNDLKSLIGIGNATIDINNLSDTTVYVTIETSEVDAEGTESTSYDNWELTPNDVQSNSEFSCTSSKTRILFGSTESGEELGACAFTLKSGDQYHFIVLPDKIVIDRVTFPEYLDQPPATGNDMILSTSTLCQ
jgi:hypothetical protein